MSRLNELQSKLREAQAKFENRQREVTERQRDAKYWADEIQSLTRELADAQRDELEESGRKAA